MMGHISAAYAARISRDLSLCSRFDFNVYSYESEWTMGAEWWIRRGFGSEVPAVENPLISAFPQTQGQPLPLPPSPSPLTTKKLDEVQGVVKARLSTNTVSM